MRKIAAAIATSILSTQIAMAQDCDAIKSGMEASYFVPPPHIKNRNGQLLKVLFTGAALEAVGVERVDFNLAVGGVVTHFDKKKHLHPVREPNLNLGYVKENLTDGTSGCRITNHYEITCEKNEKSTFTSGISGTAPRAQFKPEISYSIGYCTGTIAAPLPAAPQ